MMNPHISENDIDNKIPSEIKNFALSDTSNSNSLYDPQNVCEIRDSEPHFKSTHNNNNQSSFVISQVRSSTKGDLSDNLVFPSSSSPSSLKSQSSLQPSSSSSPFYSSPLSQPQLQSSQNEIENGYQHLSVHKNENSIIKKTVRKPILKKTFTLKKIGYKVIPYEDESDSRYSFTNENIVFVNKAHSTYKAESDRGDEFLFRHITNIVAEVVVGSKYPEARDILEIQNKLISEAIKIHDYSLIKK